MRHKNKKVKKTVKTIKRNPYQKRKHIVKRKAKKIKKYKPLTESLIKLDNDGILKRSRGRPRKNSAIVSTLNSNTGKKRGRPKKSITEYKKEEPVILAKPMKILKFAGYCPACQLTLTTQDISDSIFTCYKCNKSGKVTDLLSSIPKRETAKNKKEYLQTVNSTTYDDLDIYHKHVKDEVEDKPKEVGVENDIIDEVEDVTEPIDPIDPTEQIDLEDPVDPHVIKTDEDLTIEKELKNYLDKDDEI